MTACLLNVFRMSKTLKTGREKLFLRVSEYVAKRAIDLKPSAVRTDNGHPYGCEIKCAVEPLFAFGKFFGMAGVRLGFIVTAAPLAATIRGLIGEWPVSSDALAAGIAAYADVRWIDRERTVLQKSAQRLDALLTLNGFAIAGGTSLFRLAGAADARERFTRLLAGGILVRPFDFAPDLLRFGLPRGREQWRRLAAALGRRP